MDPAVASRPDPRDDDRVAQLTRDLADAVEQRTATSEVLATIGRSAFELEPVFETVVRHAIRLCAADGGYVYQRDGDEYRLAVAVGGPADFRDYLAAHGIPLGPGSVIGRVGAEGRTVQIADAQSEPGYQMTRARELARVPHAARRARCSPTTASPR